VNLAGVVREKILAGTPPLPSTSRGMGMRVGASATHPIVWYHGLSSPSLGHQQKEVGEDAHVAPGHDSLPRVVGWVAEVTTTYHPHKNHQRLLMLLEKQIHRTTFV